MAHATTTLKIADRRTLLCEPHNGCYDMLHRALIFVSGLLNRAAGWLIFFMFTSAAIAQPATPAHPPLQKITVQLSWTHQTQFAGFYMAQRGRYFEKEGLDVALLPGNASENPLEMLRDSRVDVAIATLRSAHAFDQTGEQVTNIAQIHQSSPILLMCRPSLGVTSDREIVGKTIGVAGGGDLLVLDELVRALFPDGGSVVKVPRDGTSQLLIQGGAACITGVTFNELLRVENSGIPTSDLLLIQPEQYGVMDFGDGLYVRTERLQSPEFRQQLVKLLNGLSKGWSDARNNPSLAVAQTVERNPQLETQFQYQALEQVLALIPERNFGLLNLEQLDRLAWTSAKAGDPITVTQHLWTHRIWNEWQQREGTAKAQTPATEHVLRGVARHPLFIWLVTFGTLVFGFGGALLGIQRGYNIWGRLLVAAMPAIGGGAARDLMIGGPRLPLYFVSDPTLPLSILTIVVLSSALIAIFPAWVKTRAFTVILFYSDVIGSAVIATGGAVVALNAGVHWVWVPVFAAISCAGGGLLLDIVTNEHPRSFRGRWFEDEERGVLSGAVLLLFVWAANQIENPGLIVYAGVVVAVALNLVVRFGREKLAKYFPNWLAASSG